jgi:hypothetical protein
MIKKILVFWRSSGVNYSNKKGLCAFLIMPEMTADDQNENAAQIS